jgi:hypothetical protein
MLPVDPKLHFKSCCWYSRTEPKRSLPTLQSQPHFLSTPSEPEHLNSENLTLSHELLHRTPINANLPILAITNGQMTRYHAESSRSRGPRQRVPLWHTCSRTYLNNLSHCHVMPHFRDPPWPKSAAMPAPVCTRGPSFPTARPPPTLPTLPTICQGGAQGTALDVACHSDES